MKITNPVHVGIFTLLAHGAITLTTAQEESHQNCYFPNRKLASKFIPCPGKNSSHCCWQSTSDALDTDLCYDNGLCRSNYWGANYRGACRNQDGTGCVDWCTDTESQRSDSAPLRYCEGKKKWCCQPKNSDSRDCCDTATANETTMYPWEGAKQLLVEQDGETAPTCSPDSNSSNPTASNENDDAANHATLVAVAAGLGVGLGVPLLAALAGLVWLWRKQRPESENKTKETPMFDGSTSSNGHHHPTEQQQHHHHQPTYYNYQPQDAALSVDSRSPAAGSSYFHGISQQNSGGYFHSVEQQQQQKDSARELSGSTVGELPS